MSSDVIASTGQASTHASQSMHSSGSMYSWSACSNPGSSGVGWMQSTGQTSTHEVSFVPMHGSLMTYAKTILRRFCTLSVEKLPHPVVFLCRMCKTRCRMDLPMSPDDPLAQPTRARLFRALSELRRPAGTEELAERLDLHPNGVRTHLERLREAGLVTRERTRQSRGRPRDMWALAPDAEPGGEPPSGYLDLGRWLARLVSEGKTSRRAVETMGREIGRDLAPAGDAASAEENMHATLAALGFRPRRELDDGGTLTYK